MSTVPADPARYNSFLGDLLGMMAYGELSAFERLSSDARYAPSLRERAVLGRSAVLEFGHYELVCTRLAEMGLDPEAAMLPFQPAVDGFHERTRPADWYESLMKAYLITTVSADFYRTVSHHADPATRELVEQIHSGDEPAAVLRELLRTALAADPRLASRLSLWARRLLGEILRLARGVWLEHAFPPGPGGEPVGRDLAGGDLTGRMTAEITTNHSRRMTQLGLAG